MVKYGDGHHHEVDAVPVGEDLSIVKVWRVARIFQKVNWKYFHLPTDNKMIKPNFFSPIPAAASQTEMNMAMSWVSLEKFSVELMDWNIFMPMLPDGSG